MFRQSGGLERNGFRDGSAGAACSAMSRARLSLARTASPHKNGITPPSNGSVGAAVPPCLLARRARVRTFSIREQAAGMVPSTAGGDVKTAFNSGMAAHTECAGAHGARLHRRGGHFSGEREIFFTVAGDPERAQPPSRRGWAAIRDSRGGINAGRSGARSRARRTC